MDDGRFTDARGGGRKIAQVLEGARTVFVTAGFEGANVDDIAREAGVSKATLYKYFPDKRLLFTEVARAECERQATMARAEIDTDRPMAAILYDIARRIGGFVTSDFGCGMIRLCIAESGRFPELGAAFYESGQKVIRHHLTGLFDLGAARGELAVDDPILAAEQFHELCQAGLFARALYNVGGPVTEADLHRTAQGAVATFLARWGAPQSNVSRAGAPEPGCPAPSGSRAPSLP